jgi:uncharacterized protein YacL
MSCESYNLAAIPRIANGRRQSRAVAQYADGTIVVVRDAAAFNVAYFRHRKDDGVR